MTGLVISHIGPWVCYAGDSLGNVKILRKAIEIGGEKIKQSNAAHAIAKADSWEKLHRLGITHVSLQRDEHLLITLSMDGTCKITDPAIGHTLFTIMNSNKCQFTGVTWIKDASSFYLVDEMGRVEVFSHFHEKIVDSAPLVELSPTNKHNILKSHTGLRNIRFFFPSVHEVSFCSYHIRATRMGTLSFSPKGIFSYFG